MMESSNDIIARIKQLEETLLWDSTRSGTDGVIQLVSVQTKRVIFAVKFIGTMYQTFRPSDGSLRAGEMFTELEGAKRYAKFTAMREILAEELRRVYIQ